MHDVIKLPEIGHQVTKNFRFTTQELIDGATFVGDENPVHHDEEFAKTTRFEELIASGSHIMGIFTGVVPSYFPQFGPILGIQTDISMRAPVLANKDYQAVWIVDAHEWSASMKGVLTTIEGRFNDLETGKATQTCHCRVLFTHATTDMIKLAA